MHCRQAFNIGQARGWQSELITPGLGALGLTGYSATSQTTSSSDFLIVSSVNVKVTNYGPETFDPAPVPERGLCL